MGSREAKQQGLPGGKLLLQRGRSSQGLVSGGYFYS